MVELAPFGGLHCIGACGALSSVCRVDWCAPPARSAVGARIAEVELLGFRRIIVKLASMLPRFGIERYDGGAESGLVQQGGFFVVAHNGHVP